jgi:predicted transcriptional regulator
LPSKSLITAGKTTLFIIGAGFGLLRTLKLLGSIAGQASTLQKLEARVDTLHVAVARVAGQREELQTRLDETVSRIVTKDELRQTLERVFGRVEEEVESRFEHQAKSVEALRTMVGQTDELLQRVLDGLESLRVDSEELSGAEK